MTIQFTKRERRQVRAYRKLVRRARGRMQTRPGIKPVHQGRGRRLSAEHKHAIAQLFCVATAVRFGVEIYGVHVAHLRYSAARYKAVNPGLQRKPDDRWCLPLCPHEHRVQHSMSEAGYWEELGIDPHNLAGLLWAVSPDQRAMLSVLRHAVNETIDTPNCERGERT
jgi:hypothetical protein